MCLLNLIELDLSLGLSTSPKSPIPDLNCQIEILVLRLHIFDFNDIDPDQPTGQSVANASGGQRIKSSDFFKSLILYQMQR
jgi:hypothetical protein